MGPNRVNVVRNLLPNGLGSEQQGRGALIVGEAATLPEAVPDETVEAPKTRRFRVPRLKREKAGEPEPTTDTTEVEVEDDLPLAYQTFSPKIAPTLTAFGGLIAILGGLGAWVRAVVVETEGIAPEEVVVSYGYDDPEGLTIAVLGGVALLTSALWLRRRPVAKVIPSFFVKVIPALVSLAIIGLVAWQLPLIDAEASELASQAIQQANFVSYHAGLGWGAWCMVAAAVLLFLGTVIGILREIDLRRGKS